MSEMRGLSLQELADLYDASTPEVKKWMLENSDAWWKENPNEDPPGFYFEPNIG